MRIIIADDDPGQRHLMKEIVIAGGHEVVKECSSGDDLIAACRETPVDLVLVDIHMNGVADGLRAKEKALRKNRVAVVMVSSDEKWASQLGRDRHIQGFVLKPLDQRVLLAEIAFARSRFEEMLVEEAEKKVLESAKDFLLSEDLNGQTPYQRIRAVSTATGQTIPAVAAKIVATHNAFLQSFALPEAP